jgi:hypothetical protein
VLSACCEIKPNDGRLRESPQLPSWIPDWRVRFEKAYQVFPLCNGPYNASGTEKPRIEYAQGSDAVRIRGVRLDSIVVVSTDLKTTRWEQVSQDWSAWSSHNHPANLYGDLEGQREAFRETFYLGMYKDNPHKHDRGKDLFDIAVRRKGNGIMKQALRGRTFGNAGRQFFGTSKGYMGRGTHGMQVGDLVVVLLGAKVPFILRESGKRGRFLLVGECC